MTDKKQAWTAEPWWTDPLDKHWISTRQRFVTTCEEIRDEPNAVDRANAARIVACVNALAGIDDPAEWNVAVYELRLAALRAVEELPLSNQLDGLKASLARVDALLALQPPTEEETSDGR